MQQESEADIERNKAMTKIVDALLKHDQSYEESQKLYKNWAALGSYDNMLHSHEEHYAGPYRVRDACVKLVTDPNTALVLDLGCGTGILAELLINEGFKNIHGLDPCKEFLELSRKKGFYQKLLEQYIGRESTVDAENDTYDAIVSNGAYCPGHIPCDAFHEIIRVIKPGGYFINAIREEFLTLAVEYKDRLVPLMEQLEKEGKWKKMVWQRFSNHFNDKDGILMVFQVC